MANRRLSMRKIKEVLRLKWGNNLSVRQIAISCDIARSTVRDYLHRALIAGLAWPVPDELDDTALGHLLYPPACCVSAGKKPLPSMEDIHQDLKKKGVTLQLLWYEYKQAHPNGYRYSQFCYLYHRWADKLDSKTNRNQ